MIGIAWVKPARIPCIAVLSIGFGIFVVHGNDSLFVRLTLEGWMSAGMADELTC